ncbi:MAG: hypothetical protein WCD79_10430 [Chthoniobacteraceae bacterium]
MSKRLVSVVVNKWYECDPIIGALINDGLLTPRLPLPWPTFISHPHARPEQLPKPPTEGSNKPRLRFEVNGTAFEIWCISDLLEGLDQSGKVQSSSKVKMEHMATIFAAQTPDLVIAMGTAAYPSADYENGSVVVGTRVFMHDGGTPGDDSNWHSDWFDQVIDSPLKREIFDVFVATWTVPGAPVLNNFIVPPLYPVLMGHLFASYDYAALGTINVWDPANYDTADRKTVETYRSQHDGSFAKSLETTHGLIRAAVPEVPFLFISGISNRMLHFSDEVAPRIYAQRTASAHNAGVVLGTMMPAIAASWASA